MNIRWLIAGLGLAAITSLATAEDDAPPPPQPDPAVTGYLDCINTEAKKQTAEGSEKISDAQAVIDACSSQKQTLLDSINGDVANQMIVQVEKHLKSRVAATTAE